MTDQGARERTTLRGPWRPIAQLVWLVLVVLVVVFWSLGTITLVSEPLPDCAEVTCDPVDFNAGDVEVAREIGLPTGLGDGLLADLIAFVPGLLFFIIAGVIFWRRSDDSMGLLVSFTLVFLGGLLFTSSNDALDRAYPELDVPVGIVSLLGLMSMAFMFYLFPDGRFVPRWTRWVAGSSLLLILAGELLPVPVALSGTGVFAQIYRYIRVSGPVERQQTKWVVFGLMGAVALIVVWSTVALAFPPDEPSRGRIYALLVVGPVLMVLLLLLPLSFGIAILRYRLWDIDVLVNRTLVYGRADGCAGGHLRRHSSGTPGGLPGDYRPGEWHRHCGFDAGHRRALPAREEARAGLHRPPLLPSQV